MFSAYSPLNAPPPIIGCDRLEVLDEFTRFLRFFNITCRLALYVTETTDWEYLLMEEKIPFVDILVANDRSKRSKLSKDVSMEEFLQIGYEIVEITDIHAFEEVIKFHSDEMYV